jgi:hypothetical protein
VARQVHGTRTPELVVYLVGLGILVIAGALSPPVRRKVSYLVPAVTARSARRASALRAIVGVVWCAGIPLLVASPALGRGWDAIVAAAYVAVAFGSTALLHWLVGHRRDLLPRLAGASGVVGACSVLVVALVFAVPARGDFVVTHDVWNGLPGTLAGLSCGSPNDCVAVGNADAFGGNGRPLIFSTADGGQTWSSARLPGGLAAGAMSGVSCWTASECDAVDGAGALLSSLDGGVTWRLASQGAPNGSHLECAGVRRCVMLTSAGRIEFLGGSGQAWHSAAASSGSMPVNDLTCLAAAASCVAVGGRLAVGGRVAAPPDLRAVQGGGGGPVPEVLVTTDFGASWQSAHVTLDAGETPVDLSCVSTRLCLVLLTGAGDAIERLVARGGRWRVGSTTPIPLRRLEPQAFTGLPQQAGGHSTPLDNLLVFPLSLTCTGSFCLANYSALLSSAPGFTLASDDDGLTWHPRDLRGGYSLDSVSCVSVGRCVAVADSSPGGGSLASVAWTRDGGRSWHLSQPRVSSGRAR